MRADGRIGDVSVMKSRDAADNRKPKPRPARFGRPGGVDPVKSLENPFDVLGRDADPVVLDGYANVLGRHLKGNDDILRTRMPNRVDDEIGDGPGKML